MKYLVNALDSLFCFFCRHEWVRDRGPKNRLLLRCMVCGKVKEHELARLIRWTPRYVPIEPIDVGELPRPLEQAPARTGTREAA